MDWLVEWLISMASAALERERQMGAGALPGPSGIFLCSDQCLPISHHLQLWHHMTGFLKQQRVAHMLTL